MKKFRKVLDGLSSSSQGAVASPSCSSAACTPPTPQNINVQETLLSENFHICKVSSVCVCVPSFPLSYFLNGPMMVYKTIQAKSLSFPFSIVTRAR
jgi:hypothetical protein